jgi:hypothetical protein
MKSQILKNLIQILVILMCASGTALGEDQIVSLFHAGGTAISEGDLVTINVQYTTSDTNNMLNTLGVRIHYDSSKLEYVGLKETFLTGIMVKNPLPQNEREVDSDGDEATDKIIILSYFSIAGDWPDAALPLKLGNLVFKVKGDTTINVTKVSVNNGYGFQGNGTAITLGAEISKKVTLQDVISLLDELSKF